MGINPIVKVSGKVVPCSAISIHMVGKWSGGSRVVVLRSGRGSLTWFWVCVFGCMLFGLFAISRDGVKKVFNCRKHATIVF